MSGIDIEIFKLMNEINNIHTPKEASTLIARLINIIEIGWGKAIKESIIASRSGDEKEAELKEKKMIKVRDGVLKCEEGLLAKEKDLINMDRRFKKTMEEMRKAYNFSKNFGDQFFT